METKNRSEYWQDGESYDRYIRSELNSFRKAAWKKQLSRHFAPGAALEILDAGTGPGFFACILAEEGHRVTGIDSSPGMLACAGRNAADLNVDPVFLKMDLNEMTFPDESFDAVVLRNVSWTLQFPAAVYTEFKRLLRPGGTLLIYDANWQLHWYDEELLQRVRERERRYAERYGREERVSNGDLAYYETAPLTRIHRPEWDVKTLTDLGFSVTVTEDIGRFVYEEWEKDLYGESPLFEICAVKRAEHPAQERMHRYWQGRAESFDRGNSLSMSGRLGAEAAPYLPEGRLKILDVGTGTGAAAIAMALLGHEVTGVDLSSNMIGRARKNAAAMKLDIRFLNTAAGELPFADESFDAVVSRNLTWALPEPEETLRQWRRVLKPGGRLLYWDANHYLYLFREEDARAREQMKALAGTVHGSNGYDEAGKPITVDYTLCDETALELPLSRLDRPGEWDENVLPRLGFGILAERVSRPQLLLPLGEAKGYYTEFFLAAVKLKPEEEMLRTY